MIILLVERKIYENVIKGSSQVLLTTSKKYQKYIFTMCAFKFQILTKSIKVTKTLKIYL